MAEYAPQHYIMNIINQINLVGILLFISILVLSICSTIINSDIKYEHLRIILYTINIVCISFLFLTETINDFILIPLADNKRRDDFIDNSFGSKFSPLSSIGYYDNDNLHIGLYKAAVNQFENCFFTNSLISLITVSKIILPLLMTIILMVLAVYGFKEVPFALTILQALLSAKILQTLVKHCILLIKLPKVLDSWIILFQNEEFKNNTIKYQASVYRHWLQYETLHSNINAGISDRVFKTHNPLLTSKWEKIRIKYNIS